MKKETKKEIAEKIAVLKLYIMERLDAEERELLKNLATEMNVENPDELFSIMLTQSKGENTSTAINPFKTHFIKSFFEIAFKNPKFFNDESKYLFHKLQRAYVIYVLELVRDKKALIEFRDRMEEARLVFRDALADDDLIYEINELLEDFETRINTPLPPIHKQ